MHVYDVRYFENKLQQYSTSTVPVLKFSTSSTLTMSINTSKWGQFNAVFIDNICYGTVWYCIARYGTVRYCTVRRAVRQGG